jgi:hypothetical protein
MPNTYAGCTVYTTKLVCSLFAGGMAAQQPRAPAATLTRPAGVAPAAAAVISGKSTVVPLPKAQEDQRGVEVLSAPNSCRVGLVRHSSMPHGAIADYNIALHFICCSHIHGARISQSPAGAAPSF